MKLAIYVPKEQHMADRRYVDMVSSLSGMEINRVSGVEQIEPGTDMLLSVGGDGTYLTAADMAACSGIPILGVNFGRLGFLSDCRPEDVPAALANGKYTIEDRQMLSASVDGGEPHFALNEVAASRVGPAMLGVDVSVDGEPLPTYWADGLLVATSSGSTAYSLSVGGPICMPDSKVLIISPVAPHNLNVRPLIVPSSSELRLSFRSRDEKLMLSWDNRNVQIGRDSQIAISLAQFSLKRVRLSSDSFIGALKSKLFWGEDVRNGRE